jgi:hypothetical protein
VAHQDMKVSLKVLKNKYYKLQAVYTLDGKYNVRGKGVLSGVILRTKGGANVWNENRGVIKLSQLSEESKEYVKNELTDHKHLIVFGSLGD